MKPCQTGPMYDPAEAGTIYVRSPVVRVRVWFAFLSDLLFLSPVLVYIRFYVRSGVQFWFVSMGLVLDCVQIGCPFFLPCVRRPFSINTYVSNWLRLVFPIYWFVSLSGITRDQTRFSVWWPHQSIHSYKALNSTGCFLSLLCPHHSPTKCPTITIFSFKLSILSLIN